MLYKKGVISCIIIGQIKIFENEIGDYNIIIVE